MKKYYYFVAFIILLVSCQKGDKPEPEIVTDFDGNVYHTVTIGTQVWMVENLRTTHNSAGDPIDNVADSTVWSNLREGDGAYVNYDNDNSNATTYGRLYNWSVVKYTSLAPEGWRIPDDDDWEILITYLGGDSIAGGKMKELGLDHWSAPNSNATNSSGFSALPGGVRDVLGNFSNIGSFGIWWSSTAHSSSLAGSRQLNWTDPSVTWLSYNKNSALSVRCIKRIY